MNILYHRPYARISNVSPLFCAFKKVSVSKIVWPFSWQPCLVIVQRHLTKYFANDVFCIKMSFRLHWRSLCLPNAMISTWAYKQLLGQLWGKRQITCYPWKTETVGQRWHKFRQSSKKTGAGPRGSVACHPNRPRILFANFSSWRKAKKLCQGTNKQATIVFTSLSVILATHNNNQSKWKGQGKAEWNTI